MPIKQLNAGVSSSTSIISLLAILGDFGGQPPPVILVSLLNSANSFLAMLWRFFHLFFTSLTVHLAVLTAFTAWVISSHSICFYFLVTAFANLDWIKSRFFFDIIGDDFNLISWKIVHSFSFFHLASTSKCTLPFHHFFRSNFFFRA